MNTVEFHNISKRYKLGDFQSSFREAVPILIKSVFKKSNPHSKKEIWALRDVSFSVEEGEAIGLIGPNGSGKTTLLKVATMITQPTSGSFIIQGRTSALIELGAGFHPDLSGRENIFLNATILGMKRQEIKDRFDEIVAFSELEEFLDTPVKRYSSGMYARLGFSVAAHVNPQILIVDEVLAVGDIAFQAKCLARMADMKREGTTIIIVSHAMARLRNLCNRMVLLFHGKKITEGTADDVINIYQNSPEYASNLKDVYAANEPKLEEDLSDETPVQITGVSIMTADGKDQEVFKTLDRIIVRINYIARKRIENPIFEIWFHSADGTRYAQHSTDWDHFSCRAIDGKGYIDFVVNSLPLVPGRYSVGISITSSDKVTRYHWQPRRYWITVKSANFGNGLVFLPHEWVEMSRPNDQK